MSKTKLLTIEDVLKRKNLYEKIDKNYYSKMFDAEIEISNTGVFEIADIMAEEESQHQKYLKIIYACCPFFKAEKLRSEFEFNEPYDLIMKVFNNNLGEIYSLGNFILKKYGFLDMESVEKVKKQ